VKPAVLLLLVYGAGLATGLLHFGATLPVMVGLALAGTWWWRQPVAVWLLAALLGRGTAHLTQLREAGRCEARMPAERQTLEGRVVEPVLPGSTRGRLRPLGLGCRGTIDAKWPDHLTVLAGSRVRVTGRWIRLSEEGARIAGLLLATDVQIASTDPDLIEHARNWLALTIRALYGARAGLVEALVVNRRGGMPPELRDRYARAGLVHILSISGFHVGVIVGWVLILGSLVGLPHARTTVLGAAVAFCYVLFLGWPAPAARAAILVGLAALFRLRQRNPQAIPLLAVAALLVVLVDPRAALDGGAWLSVSALTGALLATRWSNQALSPWWGWRTLFSSVGATLATAPITAALFGMVSIVGIALNFVAIPLAALAVPGLLVSLLLSLISVHVAAPFAAGAGALLGALDQVAWWGGGWDGAAIVQPTGVRSAIPWVVILGFAAWGLEAGRARLEVLRRLTLGAGAMVWIALGVEQCSAIRDANSGLALHFLDVGQGDAAAIRTPGGHWVLIDAGPQNERQDAGRTVVAPFLVRHRVGGLALTIVSHAHADHLGGVPAVLDRVPTAGVLEPVELVADSLYLHFLDLVEARDVPWYAARAGQHFVLDSVRFTVIHPDTAWRQWRLDLNEDSAVLLVEYRDFRAVFPGDAGLQAEARMVERIGMADVLKVGHHGSRGASGDAWLTALDPSVAVISSGHGNRYGHPHAETLARLARHGISVWRTDQSGTITVTTDGRIFTVAGGGRHQTFATRGSSRAAAH
jgi:competence protein ComEC